VPAYCLPLPGLQLASFAIVVNQLRNIYDAFFLSECDRCRGTGLVTCPHVSLGRPGGGLAGALLAYRRAARHLRDVLPTKSCLPEGL
jgi:hypothetical protein